MKLTERAGRGLELTPAAALLVGHTEALLSRLDAAESDLAALRDQVAGRVTLAAFPSVAASLVPAAWAGLAARPRRCGSTWWRWSPRSGSPDSRQRSVDGDVLSQLGYGIAVRLTDGGRATMRVLLSSNLSRQD